MVQDIFADAGEARTQVASRSDAFEASEGVAWARDSIVFSSCNEDSGSELRAFGELEGKRILCITAGGGRVLNLLAGRPELICAVDLNPGRQTAMRACPFSPRGGGRAG